VESRLTLLDAKARYVIWPHASVDPLDLRKKFYLKKVIGPLVLRQILQGGLLICCTLMKEAERFGTYTAPVRKHVLTSPAY